MFFFYILIHLFTRISNNLLLERLRVFIYYIGMNYYFVHLYVYVYLIYKNNTNAIRLILMKSAVHSYLLYYYHSFIHWHSLTHLYYIGKTKNSRDKKTRGTNVL